jgi:beta-galactosidase beta subunit
MTACSRCKVKRELGVTDGLKTDLEEFRTCQTCRNKLKEYRKSHVSKKRKCKEDEKFIKDDQINVAIMSTIDKNLKKKLHIHKKYADFQHILKIIYENSMIKDLEIDEICKIDEFALPHFLVNSNKSINKNNKTNDGDGDGDGDDDDNDNDADNDNDINSDIDSGFTNLLVKQTEKDEHFKIDLMNSLDVHYTSRIKKVLQTCGFDFRFYVSSWKNGKYYTSFRCFDDKCAMKRFGISAATTVTTSTKEPILDYKNEYSNTTQINNNISILKKKLLDWVEPIEMDAVNLNLEVENEPVSLHFNSTPGFYCDSKLNFIVDYSKFEFRIKLTHKFHRSELKILKNNSSDNIKPKENFQYTEKTSNMNRNNFSKQSIIEVTNRKETEKSDELKTNYTKLSDKLDKLHKTLEL